MIPRELLKALRRIEITTNRLATEQLSGNYTSVFKGQGLAFREVREYQPGDDVRDIDWNVTARTGHPHVKRFVEERDLTLLLLVDVSGSQAFGSRYLLKRDYAAALADFPGVRRRPALPGSRDGARIYDDHPHHPTEVRAALAGLRELRPTRLLAVFQPHLYSRTKALATEFGAALAAADEVVVLDVYPAREQPIGELAGVSGLRVAEAAARRGRPERRAAAREGRTLRSPADRRSLAGAVPRGANARAAHHRQAG